MMRLNNQGKVEAVNSEPPLENGLPTKEDENRLRENVQELAAQVVEDIVQMASEAAQQRSSSDRNTTPKNRASDLPRLPTIQIDTVPSAPSSPVDWTPPDESIEEESVSEEPLNESDIQLVLDGEIQEQGSSSEELRESLKTYIEDVVSEAMVLAEKKLQFAGLPEENEDQIDKGGPSEPGPSSSAQPELGQCSSTPEPEMDSSEIRATAEQVVQEVITKASETAAEKLENGVAAGISFPGLPSIQIDTVKSAPPSPESEEEPERPRKKWTFKVEEDSDSEKGPEPQKGPTKTDPIKFEDAPEDVKATAQSFVKDIVGKAVAMAEEKSASTVPFNFEDVDLMKTSGPWYIRAREALIRLLRTACFCTPRRTDS